jgi:hypothetical protein
MATIATTTASPICQYPSQSKLDRDPLTGYLWAVTKSSAGDFVFYRSTDNGNTWSLRSTITRANVQEWGSIMIDNSNNLHWTYRTNESSRDKVFYRRMTISTEVWSSELLAGDAPNGGVAGSIIQGLDMQTVLYPNSETGTIYVAIAGGTQISGKIGVTCWGVTVSQATKSQKSNNAIFRNQRQWLYSGTTGRVTPSVDFEHIGDGKSSPVPHLWISFGRFNVRCLKLAWNAGWTGPTSAALVTSSVVTPGMDFIPGRWDGKRFIIATQHPSSTSTVIVHQRNASNTSGLTALVTPAHPQGVVRYVSLSYNHKNQNIRIFAVGTTTDVLYYVDYTRSTGSWGAWTQVTATAILSANNFGTRRGTYGNSKFDVYTAHSGAPNTFAHNPGAFPSVPSPPTWNAATGTSGEPRNVNASLVLDWDFIDFDPGDTQSAYALSRQIGGGAVQYWRASDSTWQAAEVKNTSSTSSVTLASSWGVDGGLPHYYKAKVWDAADSASLYGNPFTVMPSAQVNPSITSPTADQVITTPNVTLTWTASEQTAYRIVLKPNPNPDAITTHDTGWITSTDLTHEVETTLANGTAWTVTLETKNNEGLASTVQSRNFSVDYIEPSVPTLVVTPQPTLGVMRIVATNPVAGPSTFVGVGTGVTGNNASLQPPLPASLVADDSLFLVATIRNAGTGSPNTPAGWELLATNDSVKLFGKRYVVGDSNNTPTVTFTGGAAGEDTTAQIVAFRGAAVFASGSANSSGAAAQNITYPSLTITTNGQVVLLIGFKQDDWTSVATVGGFTEIGEVTSIAGNDSGHVWDYVIQTTAANITGASFTVTGGVTANTRGMTVAIGFKPDLASQDLYRRVVGESGDGIRVATGLVSGATYDDYTATSGVAYEYRARAFGVNGTIIDGAWTA